MKKAFGLSITNEGAIKALLETDKEAKEHVVEHKVGYVSFDAPRYATRARRAQEGEGKGEDTVVSVAYDVAHLPAGVTLTPWFEASTIARYLRKMAESIETFGSARYTPPAGLLGMLEPCLADDWAIRANYDALDAARSKTIEGAKAVNAAAVLRVAGEGKAYDKALAALKEALQEAVEAHKVCTAERCKLAAVLDAYSDAPAIVAMHASGGTYETMAKAAHEAGDFRREKVRKAYCAACDASISTLAKADLAVTAAWEAYAKATKEPSKGLVEIGA